METTKESNNLRRVAIVACSIWCVPASCFKAHFAPSLQEPCPSKALTLRFMQSM